MDSCHVPVEREDQGGVGRDSGGLCPELDWAWVECCIGGLKVDSYVLVQVANVGDRDADGCYSGGGVAPRIVLCRRDLETGKVYVDYGIDLV